MCLRRPPSPLPSASIWSSAVGWFSFRHESSPRPPVCLPFADGLGFGLPTGLYFHKRKPIAPGPAGQDDAAAVGGKRSDCTQVKPGRTHSKSPVHWRTRPSSATNGETRPFRRQGDCSEDVSGHRLAGDPSVRIRCSPSGSCPTDMALCKAKRGLYERRFASKGGFYNMPI